MIEVKELEKLAKQKEKENLRFRNFLKMHADSDELDKQFRVLHEKYFKIYDCSKCRNCCKKIGTIIKNDELDIICKQLQLNKEKFINSDLEEKFGEYSFKKHKCLFLDKNDNCIISYCLPKSCQEYPYTNKSERLFSLYSIISNASICPVVYEIIEELKKEYKFR